MFTLNKKILFVAALLLATVTLTSQASFFGSQKENPTYKSMILDYYKPKIRASRGDFSYKYSQEDIISQKTRNGLVGEMVVSTVIVKYSDTTEHLIVVAFFSKNKNGSVQFTDPVGDIVHESHYSKNYFKSKVEELKEDYHKILVRYKKIQA